jgi:hypothetical protein
MTFEHDPDPLGPPPPPAHSRMVDRNLVATGAPIRGSTDRPDFRGAPTLFRNPSAPPRTGELLLDTHERLARDQARREAAAKADRERIAAMPTREEREARQMEALLADVAKLRCESERQAKELAAVRRRLAVLEGSAQATGRGRPRTTPTDDTPPAAA